MTEAQIFITFIIMTAVTVLSRFLPFLFFKSDKPTPKIIEYFGKTLPYASVALLVIYCLKGMSFSQLSGFLPLLIAIAVTAALHAWKGKTLLSIATGTVLYMILVQFVFA